jgi:hypothetical protein
MSRKIFSSGICRLILLGISILTVSCDGKLSRSDAASLIASDKNFSKSMEMSIRIGTQINKGDLSKSSFDEALVSEGYVEMQNNPYGDVLNLTDKGRKESANWEKFKQLGIIDMYKIPYAKREIIEITGISEPKSGENFSQAKFSWRPQPGNDIGRAMDKSEFEKTFDGEAFFQKFDDGWRVVRISGRGLPDSY